MTLWFKRWFLFGLMMAGFYFGLSESIMRFIYRQHNSDIVDFFLQRHYLFSEEFYAADFKLKLTQLFLAVTSIFLLVAVAAQKNLRINTPNLLFPVESSLMQTLGRWALFFTVLIILGKLVILLRVILTCTWQLPLWDSITNIPPLEKVFDGRVTFSDLWGKYGDHRNFTYRALTVPIAKLSHWNLIWETVLTYCFTLGSLSVIFFKLFQIKNKLGTPAFCVLVLWSALLLTSFSHSRMWFWNQGLIYALCLFLILLGLAVASSDKFSLIRFFIVCFCGAAANLTFSTGLNFWPVAFLLIFWNTSISKKSKMAYGAIFIVLAMFVVTTYMKGLLKGNGNLEFSNQFLENPLPFFNFVFSFIGAMWPVKSCALIGLAGLILAGLILLHRETKEVLLRNQYSFFVGLIIYAIANSLLIAYGRAYGYPDDFSLKPRFLIWSFPLWVGLFTILWGLLKYLEKKRINVIGLNCFCIILAAVQIIGFVLVEQRSNVDLRIIRDKKADVLKYEAPENVLLREELMRMDLGGFERAYSQRFPLLEKYKLAIFRK